MNLILSGMPGELSMILNSAGMFLKLQTKRLLQQKVLSDGESKRTSDGGLSSPY